jgi:hypothetical protein
MEKINNLELWEKVRSCPIEAQKSIGAGRLKGMTDVNPVWRIKTLTEQYGPCGIGWYAPITEKWIDEGAKGEKVVNVQIDLYVKKDGEWSKPIQGIGGSKLIESETAGLHTNDEAYKMAYTDALSVSCKALGIAADIYWDKDKTKYTKPETPTEAPKVEALKPIAKIAPPVTEAKADPLTDADRREMDRLNIAPSKLGAYLQTKPEDLTHEQASEAIKAKKKALEDKAKKEAVNGKV